MPAPPGPGQPGYVPPRRYGDARLDSGASFGDAGAEELRRRQAAAVGGGTYDPEFARRVIRRGIAWRRFFTWGMLLPWFALFAAATAYGIATAHADNAIFAGAVTAVLFLLIRRSARRLRRDRERLRDVG